MVIRNTSGGGFSGATAAVVTTAAMLPAAMLIWAEVNRCIAVKVTTPMPAGSDAPETTKVIIRQRLTVEPSNVPPTQSCQGIAIALTVPPIAIAAPMHVRAGSALSTCERIPRRSSRPWLVAIRIVSAPPRPKSSIIASRKMELMTATRPNSSGASDLAATPSVANEAAAMTTRTSTVEIVPRTTARSRRLARDSESVSDMTAG